MAAPAPGTPTIAGVLDQFLAEHRARLAPATMRDCEGVVSLLRPFLDDYATVADRDLAKAIEAARERGESAPGFTWRRLT